MTYLKHNMMKDNIEDEGDWSSEEAGEWSDDSQINADVPSMTPEEDDIIKEKFEV